ncbi:hypothetical protein CV103_14215 [Sphingomonas fennica]|uniref:Uncharacterized protein n=2 Tax=Edaphosphingomonas TaxID=3423724 RepID=A0A2T4HT81_9SPHN|nr:hypothetical protein G432_09855 [Sphingomonas sp. MM-1]PTD19005.1 hypothetical protein CV103_14215 [Sphingomonas fennica]
MNVVHCLLRAAANMIPSPCDHRKSDEWRGAFMEHYESVVQECGFRLLCVASGLVASFSAIIYLALT